MPRPIIATINSIALKKNLSIVRKYASNSRVWSVIKANAYGHGLDSVLIGLKKTDGFAQLDINEAIILREKGWNGPILLLEGFFHATDLQEIDHYKLTTVIHSKWQVEALSKINPKTPIEIYLKLNSGMNRLGFNKSLFRDTWKILRKMKQVSSITLMTHFSCSNKKKETEKQMKIVYKAIKGFSGDRCFANSGAILQHPNTHEQWVRAGIILYGASPNGEWKYIEDIGLKPVMNLYSEIISIQKISNSGYIGYNKCNYDLKKKRVGIVACGYADGYPRHATIGTPILVDGFRTIILGSVTMDMLIVDLTYCKNVHIGSSVELWGDNIKIDEVAKFSNTVGYELMSALSKRVPVHIL